MPAQLFCIAFQCWAGKQNQDKIAEYFQLKYVGLCPVIWGLAACHFDRRIVALAFSGLSRFGHIFGLAKRHTVWTDAFARKIEALPQIRQFHAPAMILAGGCATIKTCAAFVTSKLVHFSLHYCA